MDRKKNHKKISKDKSKSRLIHITLEGRILVGLICFQLAVLLIWLIMDHSTTLGDESRHLSISLQILDALKHPNPQTINQILYRAYMYPPFYYLVVQPFYFFMGKGPDVTVFITNGIFLILAMWGIYGIGKIYFDRLTGLLAAFLTGAYPLFIKFTRLYYNDYALIGLSIFAIYMLIASKRFSSRRHCILFGLLCMAGMLTKWTYFLFVSGAFIWEMAVFSMERWASNGVGVKEKMKSLFRPDRRLLNLFLLIIAALSLSLPWYLSQMSLILEHFRGTQESTTAFHQSENLLSLSNFIRLPWSFYFKLSPPFYILFTAGLILGIVKYPRKILPVLFWLLPSFIFFTMIHSKSEKHTMSYLPLMALITVFPFVKLFDESLSKKKVVAGITVMISILALVIFSFFRIGSYGYPPGIKGEWSVRDFLKVVYDDMEREKSRESRLFITTTIDGIHHVVFDYYDQLLSPDGMNLRISSIRFDKNPYLQLVGKDYYFTKTNDLYPPVTRPPEEVKKIYHKEREFLLENAGKSGDFFEIIYTKQLEDDSTGYLLKSRKKESEIRPHALKKAIEEDPRDVEAILELSKLISKQNPKMAGRLKASAIMILEEEADKKSPRAADLYKLSDLYEEFNQPEKQRDVLERLLDLYPKHTHALNAMGEISAREGNLEEAEKYFRKAIATAPSHMHTHQRLGEIFIIFGKHEEACKVYENALKIKPDDFNIRLRLGRLLYYLEEYQQAAEVLKKAEKLKPEHDDALFWLALSLHKSGEEGEARKIKKRLLEITGNKQYRTVINREIP